VLQGDIFSPEAVRELDRRAERFARPADDLFSGLQAEFDIQPLGVGCRVCFSRFPYH
jgi:hypothetical protein